MICSACREDDHIQCANRTVSVAPGVLVDTTKSWCDCQHHPHGTLVTRQDLTSTAGSDTLKT